MEISKKGRERGLRASNALSIASADENQPPPSGSTPAALRLCRKFAKRPRQNALVLSALFGAASTLSGQAGSSWSACGRLRTIRPGLAVTTSGKR